MCKVSIIQSTNGKNINCNCKLPWAYYKVLHEAISYEKFNMRLHDPSWNLTCVQSFRFVLFMIFEIQGSKLKKNKKNRENELFVIYLLLYYSDAIITIF